ncbi:MAG: hypothetical protein ACOYL3_07205 [Desulfuromonadaceae bacterium]
MTGEQLILNRLERIEMMLERVVAGVPAVDAGYPVGAMRGGKSFAMRCAESEARRKQLDEMAARRKLKKAQQQAGA